MALLHCINILTHLILAHLCHYFNLTQILIIPVIFFLFHSHYYCLVSSTLLIYPTDNYSHVPIVGIDTERDTTHWYSLELKGHLNPGDPRY